MLIWQKQ